MHRFIVTPESAKNIFARIHEIAGRMLVAGNIEIMIKKPSRSSQQNAHFHALISEISRAEEFQGKHFEVVKALLVDWFADEMAAQDTPLKNPPKTVWDWRRKTYVSIRPSTADFRVGEAAQFIEYLYAFGVELGVEFSDPALAIYETYREAK